MKIIFLDFDGVLNNISNLENRGNDEFKKFHVETDEMNYASLNNIENLTKMFIYCIKNDIKIVVSSSWSLYGLKRVKEKMYEVFGRYFIDSLFIDTTNFIVYEENNIKLDIPIRTVEIIRWMLDNNYSNTEYLIIDDESVLFSEYDIEHKLVKTNSKLGFTINEFETVKNIFNQNNFKDNIITTLELDTIEKIKLLKPLKERG